MYPPFCGLSFLFSDLTRASLTGIIRFGQFFPKQFTVRRSQFFLKMCPPFASLLVSALFRWPCSISIHLSPRSVTGGVRPFPLAM